MSLLVNLVPISADKKIYGDIIYVELKEAHNTLQVPSRGSLFQPTINDKSFLGSIQLKGISAIFDIIRCVKPLDYLIIWFEIS